jgi:hypothetical protein
MDTIISEVSNKKSAFKGHVVPSIVTSCLALSAAIPLTAALASSSVPVSANGLPAGATTTTASVCGTPTATHASYPTAAAPHGTVVNTAYYTTPSGNGNNNGNGGGQGNGNGNGNTGQGNGNGNGSGSNANGNTQTATGGLVGGVNAIVPVSALNGSLNGVLSGNTVSVPVLSGNATSVSALNNVLNSVNTVTTTLGL